MLSPARVLVSGAACPLLFSCPASYCASSASAGGLGLPHSASSQGMPAPSGSQLFARRSQHQRHSGGWFSPGATVQSRAASAGPENSAHAGNGLGALSPASPGAGGHPAFPSSAAAACCPPVGSAGAVGSAALDVQGSLAGSGGAAGQQPAQAVMQKVVLSLKVMVAAGTVCGFHIGGGLEVSSNETSGVPVSLAGRGAVSGCPLAAHVSLPCIAVRAAFFWCASPS